MSGEAVAIRESKVHLAHLVSRFFQVLRTAAARLNLQNDLANLGMLSFPAVDEVVIRYYLEVSRELLATPASIIVCRVSDVLE